MFDYSNETLVHYGDLVHQDRRLQEVNIQSILFEAPGVFWITSWNRGICKLTVRTGKEYSPVILEDTLVFYENITDINNSNIDNCFISICKADNIIWLGSNVDGLVKMTLMEDGSAEFIKYDQLKGAPANSVYSTLKDKNGNIWISTNHGMGKFNPQSERFYNYYETDGLLSNAFIWNSFHQNSEGTIFLGGLNGLISFTPESLPEKSEKFTLHFTRLIINNKEIQIGDKINGRQILSKDINYTQALTLVRIPAFSLEFAAINPANPQEVNYFYKLDGYESEWNQTTSDNRLITYSNLHQGDYTLMVRASGNPGDENHNNAFLKITILPPWWQTTYALLGFTVLFVLLLILLRWLILTRIRLVHDAKFEHMERQKTNELYQFKMQFFTDISHEFGNLLSLILSPLQNIALKAGNDPELAEQSKLIKKNSERLLRLTEQVIDLRKIDLNKMKLILSKNDLVEYLRDLTYSYNEIAGQRSIRLVFVSDPPNCITWFDESKMDRIMYNLLSNAFRYTRDGGEIKVEVRINGANPVQNTGISREQKIMEIMIRDSGIGIPAKYMSQVFNRFLRIERKESETRRGTGLGLAMTKELVELMKGSISLESEENKGTSFLIRLPLIEDPGEPDEMTEILTGNAQKTPDLPSGVINEELIFSAKSDSTTESVIEGKDKPLILIVEDESEIRSFLNDNLSSNYHIHEAGNGRSGFELALKIEPDIIITDIIMPEMDGLELCSQIKSDPRTSHIPVILLSARTGLENKLKGIETGADAYIEKPFIIDLVKTQIHSILNSRNLLKMKFSKELIVKPSDITITPADSTILDKAISIVEKKMSDGGFGPSEFAREIGMSRSSLHRKLKTLTSMTASEFIQSIRLQRASGLINSSQLSIEEISIMVGFNSPAYFTKCYKKYFGTTPTGFKSEKSGKLNQT
jgi:signal transduction histidine kinase/CheY-like chemotaxis protein/AraC-like DNA-binding protein